MLIDRRNKAEHGAHYEDGGVNEENKSEVCTRFPFEASQEVQIGAKQCYAD
jgi:hypothetical protein